MKPDEKSSEKLKSLFGELICIFFFLQQRRLLSGFPFYSNSQLCFFFFFSPSSSRNYSTLNRYIYIPIHKHIEDNKEQKKKYINTCVPICTCTMKAVQSSNICPGIPAKLTHVVTSHHPLLLRVVIRVYPYFGATFKYTGT